MPLAIDRLALGPRERGRGYGVIAASLGLTLPNEALAAVEDFNLRIGEHVAAGREIHACFPISAPPARELWFVSTTVVHGREAGNVVWVTWGVVLDRSQMTALEARPFRLFGLLADKRRPKVGEKLTPLEVVPDQLPPLAGGAPDEASLAKYAVHLGKKPLFLEVRKPMVALATLQGMMECLMPLDREEISFADAPIPLRSWDLVAFQRERWEDAPRFATAGADHLHVDEAGISGGSPASVPDFVWAGLRRVIEGSRAPGAESLVREMSAQRRLELAQGDDLATIEARLVGVLDGVRRSGGEAAAVERMVQLFTAASQLPDTLRRPAAAAMLAGWEEMFGRVTDRLEWFSALHGRGAAIHRRLDVPERLLPRIAAEHRLALSLHPQAAEEMGEALTTVFRRLVLEQSVDPAEGRPESASVLLARLLPRLAERGPERKEEWTLANQLCRTALRLADGPASTENSGHRKRTSKILIEFLESVVRMRRADGIETLFQPQSRVRMRMLLGADFEDACKRTRAAAADLLEKARSWTFAFAVERRVRP